MNNGKKQIWITRRGLLLAAGGVGLLAGLPRAKALDAAEQYVSRLGTEIIGLARSGLPKQAMRRRFAAIVNRHANVRGVAVLALGPYQKELPADRREEFFRFVADYIAAFFVYYANEFRGSDFEVKSSYSQGRSTVVESKIILSGGRNADVSWRVTGGRVSDVKVRGIWLSLQLRKRFNDILRRSGGDFEPLFAELRSAETW
ncbi:MAG: phospholipid-binding protein MlaC [Hyphomicrobiales bacterium]